MPTDENRARCVYCGATESLAADPELEDIWYCGDCRKRQDEHRGIIDHGFDDEEPSHE